MKAIIIDDERLARQELKNLLSVHKEIEIVAECANAEEAKEKIDKCFPSIFLRDLCEAFVFFVLKHLP